MPGQKPPIIEALFRQRWDERSRVLRDPVVTLTDVDAAIRAYNQQHPNRALSTRNPANFFKDFIRNKRSANANWPKGVWQLGYAAKQVTGENWCFEFIQAEQGQTEPFPLNRVPGPTANTPLHKIESTSMPLASRSLGRNDETWLTQVLVRLRVVETHLALYSARPVVQVDHLQMAVKGTPSEIDSLYLIHEEAAGGHREAIVTLEAKGLRDDILEDQIQAQVRTVFGMPEVKQDIVVPMAAKAIRPSEIHVVEFEAISRHQTGQAPNLVISSEAVYVLVPAVPGIGVQRSARGRIRRRSSSV